MSKSETKKEEQVKDVHCKTPAKIVKTRYWEAVLWEENLIDDWENKIADTIQVPFAYCKHDKDKEKDGSPRKSHIHMIIVFSNTTTYNHALTVFRLLGEKATNTCTACVSIRNCYEYLIHNTETARKDKKYQYDKSERITGNNFDIGMFEQLSLQERDELTKEISIMICGAQICNFADLFMKLCEDFDSRYLEVLFSRSSLFEKLTRGMWLKTQQKSGINNQKCNDNNTNIITKCCPDCGSIAYVKNGKRRGKQSYLCRDCGTQFS